MAAVAAIVAFVVLAPSGSAQAAGLVAAYGFEEGSGTTAADASGKGHVGTIREATWTTAGHAGNGLTFDGVNDWVTVAHAADLDTSRAPAPSRRTCCRPAPARIARR